jgi:hypothetical protein
MVAAHPPDGHPPALHTGDARLTRAATQGCPVLQAMRGRAVLVLDTTYCDPQYCFPSQQEVVESVVRAVKVRWGGWSSWRVRLRYLCPPKQAQSTKANQPSE